MEHCKLFSQFLNTVKAMTEEERNEVLDASPIRLEGILAAILLGENTANYVKQHGKSDGREDDWECDLRKYLFDAALSSQRSMRTFVIQTTERIDTIRELQETLARETEWVTVSINSFYDRVDELHKVVIHYYI